MNLGIARAANKGMCGLSCMYHDVTLAIVTAHFASDKKGKNRVANRNKVTAGVGKMEHAHKESLP